MTTTARTTATPPITPLVMSDIRGCTPVSSHRDARTLRRHLRHAEELAVLHHRQDAPAILQDADVGNGIAIDKDEVREIPRLQLAQLAGTAHDFAAMLGRPQQHFDG